MEIEDGIEVQGICWMENDWTKLAIVATAKLGACGLCICDCRNRSI